jgi:polyisoprenoid-binding protein YceI
LYRQKLKTKTIAMIKNITMTVIAAAAVTAFSFTTPEAKKETTYTVDTKTTTATWLAKKVTGQHSGTVNVSKGSIESKGGTSISGGTIEFDMTSIACTDLTDPEWNGKLVGHLKSDDFFSVDKHPKATFVITKTAAKSNTEMNITGNLTIKGITHEITFPAMVKMDGKTLVAVAKIMVDRTKYDIKYGSKSFVEGIGDKAIDDEFEMNVNLVAAAK